MQYSQRNHFGCVSVIAIWLINFDGPIHFAKSKWFKYGLLFALTYVFVLCRHLYRTCFSKIIKSIFATFGLSGFIKQLSSWGNNNLLFDLYSLLHKFWNCTFSFWCPLKLDFISESVLNFFWSLSKSIGALSRCRKDKIPSSKLVLDNLIRLLSKITLNLCWRLFEMMLSEARFKWLNEFLSSSPSKVKAS